MVAVKVRKVVIETIEVEAEEASKYITEVRIHGDQLDLFCRDPNRNGFLVRVASIPRPTWLVGDEDALLDYGRKNIPEGVTLYG